MAIVRKKAQMWSKLKDISCYKKSIDHIFKKTRRKGQKVMILSQLIDWSHNSYPNWKLNMTTIVCANDILNQFGSEMNFLEMSTK